MDNELIQILESLKTNLAKTQKNDEMPLAEQLEENQDLINSCQRMITNELEN